MIEEKKVCLLCGKQIIGKRDTAKFCNDKCRNKYNNDMKSKQKTPPAKLSDVLDELKEIKSILSDQNERILTVDQCLKTIDILIHFLFDLVHLDFQFCLFQTVHLLFKFFLLILDVLFLCPEVIIIHHKLFIFSGIYKSKKHER